MYEAHGGIKGLWVIPVEWIINEGGEREREKEREKRERKKEREREEEITLWWKRSVDMMLMDAATNRTEARICQLSYDDVYYDEMRRTDICPARTTCACFVVRTLISYTSQARA